VKVATIQTAPVFKDKPGNIQRMVGLVKDAASNGAQLIVLPELCTTGYSFMSAEDARPFAECPSWLDDECNPETAVCVMAEGARKLGVHIVFGFVELDPGNDKLYNSQLYVGPDGHYETCRKINQWGNDFLWCSEGQSNPPVVRTTVDGEEWKVGLLICRDIRDKKDSEWKSFYEPGDADVVCFSANWGDGGFPATSWMEFAKDNNTTLIVSNRYGKETCNDFGEGGVCVVEPGGKVHCQGVVWNQDCIVYADLTKGKSDGDR